MSTFVDGLATALSEEAQVHHARYLEFARQAEAGQYPQVAKFFRAIVACETARANLYQRCLVECLSEAYDYYICPECGVTVGGEAPDKCPLCDTPGVRFERID